jgi:alkanesulfonate monooxygenase SsuD/methylene tetrahydromethanopterin reductase-like flavin-dependent oxidoreductase (luciferase family)
MPGKHKVQFGVYIPQLGFPFDEIKRRVQLADRLGYHSVWFMDHLYPPQMPKVPSFEAWTTVSALAPVTERVRLGHLVLASGFRHPGLLAKMVTSLDVISNGRVEVGIGTGSVPLEHKQFDIPFPKNPERTERLAEAIQIMKSMFTQEVTNFQGKYWRIENAPSLPLPVQKPNPPIIVGGSGEKYTIPLVARLADGWNCPTYGVGELQRKINVLKDECRKIGRDPSTLRLTEESVLVIVPKKSDIPAAMGQAKRRYGGGGWGLEVGGYIGTPEDIIKRVQERSALGLSLFTFFFYDRAAPETMELLAKQVFPAFA